MPIVERNSKRAFDRFESHMKEVVCAVLSLPGGVTLVLTRRENSGVMEFVRGGVGTSVPLDTMLGELHLSLNQDLVALREGRLYRLRTLRYEYKLLPTADPEAEAIIRWEFRADTPDHAECRNHMHVNASLPVGHGTLTLGRVHIPTAWVLIEHVLRFLFHDLHVSPRTQDWPQILRASETKFYEEFTSKRYRWRG